MHKSNLVFFIQLVEVSPKIQIILKLTLILVVCSQSE
jgi:hypothetical protein